MEACLHLRVKVNNSIVELSFPLQAVIHILCVLEGIEGKIKQRELIENLGYVVI